MTKIMIIEDDITIREELKIFLNRYGYEISAPNEFQNIIDLIKEEAPNLILLDINLPKFDGFYYLKLIRNKSKTPVIILSARSDEGEQIRGMELGADDYITKPFVVGILLAKINALLRRVNEYIDEGKLTDDKKDLYLIHESMKLRYKEDIIELTKNEYRILNILLTKEGQIVTREEILEALWDDAVFVDDNTLTVNMTRVKKKLSDLGIKNAIITKRGVGYVFNGLDS